MILVADTGDAVADEIAALTGAPVTRAPPGEAAAIAAEGAPPEVVVVVERDGPLDAVIDELARTIAARLIVYTPRAGDLALATLGADTIGWPIARLELAAKLHRALEQPRADGSRRRPRKSDVIVGSGPWLKEIFD